MQIYFCRREDAEAAASRMRSSSFGGVRFLPSVHRCKVSRLVGKAFADARIKDGLRDIRVVERGSGDFLYFHITDDPIGPWMVSAPDDSSMISSIVRQVQCDCLP